MSYPVLWSVDLGLAVLTAAATGAAVYCATVPALLRWVRLLLAVAAAGWVVRLVDVLLLLRPDPAFGLRQAGYQLPLVGVPLAAAILLAGRPGGPAGFPVVWTAASAATLAVLDLLLRPDPPSTALLTLLAVLGPAVVALAVGADRRRAWLARAGAVTVVVLLTGWIGVAWWTSRLPGSYDLSDYAGVDAGGGSAPAQMMPMAGAGDHAMTGDHEMTGDRSVAGAVSVASLTGPATGVPDVTYTLTAARTSVRTADGRTRSAVAFDGQVPGPVLTAHVGDLVAITLHNRDVPEGVTIHWHGYDVPNAEDGVAGVTQHAVPPGSSYLYRFRAEQSGTYWYHAHQASSVLVEAGLYGALVVLPRGTDGQGGTGGQGAQGVDLTVLDHAWRPPGGFTAGTSFDQDQLVERRDVATGRAVRLRIVNTGNAPRRYRVQGTPFRLAAIDGTEVVGGAPIGGPGSPDRSLLLAAGGRYDLTFTMPAGPVTLTGLGEGVRLVLGSGPPAGSSGQPPPDLDLLSYGTPGPAPDSVAAGPFDRDFRLVIDRQLGFRGGKLGYQWTVNGAAYPRMPMLMVQRGDRVRVTFVNRSLSDHPMHLHGHHVLVLARNGRPSSGSPWWTDTLNVAPGQTFTVAFRADNPGVWMDHCHDLEHAVDGFVMHLAYVGVRTPYTVGAATGDQPE